MWGFGVNASFSTLLMSSGVCFQYGFYPARNGPVTDLPNKTSASQRDKCDVLEQYKNESIKYQASELFGESAVFHQKFLGQNF